MEIYSSKTQYHKYLRKICEQYNSVSANIGPWMSLVMYGLNLQVHEADFPYFYIYI